MTFDDITEDGRLWAVRYEGDNENALYRLFDQWSDVAIKLTATMQEREHTLKELHKMEKVRQFLLSENIVDEDSFTDYLSET